MSIFIYFFGLRATQWSASGTLFLCGGGDDDDDGEGRAGSSGKCSTRAALQRERERERDVKSWSQISTGQYFCIYMDRNGSCARIIIVIIDHHCHNELVQ